MAPKTKKILIITLISVAVLVIAIIFIALYLSTDFMKSDKTLFLKYLSQNTDEVREFVEPKSESEYSQLLKQNKFESKSELAASYVENANTSEENKDSALNKLRLKIEEQSDYQNNYDYKNMEVTNDGNSLIKTEYVHDGTIYGIRLSDMFTQFVSVENSNLKEVAQKAGLSQEEVDNIPDTIEDIDLNQILNFTDEEYTQEQSKYLKVIEDNVPKDNYSKSKNAVITVGDNSITTNAYTVTLTEEQLNNIYVKLLEELKSDDTILNKFSQNEIITALYHLYQKENNTSTEGASNSENTNQNTDTQNSESTDQTTDQDANQTSNETSNETANDNTTIGGSTEQNSDSSNSSDALRQEIINKIEKKIKEIEDTNIGTNQVTITVNEVNGQTIRTTIDEETQTRTLDFTAIENGNELSFTEDNKDGNGSTKSIDIESTNSDLKDTYNININNKSNGIEKVAQIYRNKSIDGTKVSVETGLTYDDGKENELQVKYGKNIEIKDDIQRKIQLDDNNNIILNNFDAERVSSIYGTMKDGINKRISENQELIDNARDTIYVKILGKSKPNVQIEQTGQMSDIEKNKFNSKFEFYTGENKTKEDVLALLNEVRGNLKKAQVSYSDNGSSSSDNKELQSINLEIERGTENDALADSVKDLIKEDSYTVAIGYDNNTGVVSNITISVKD